VVLVGWPNVGKSSLFNALTRSSAALVSSEPGTTRDYLVAHQQWRDVSWDLFDTAGVEPAPERHSPLATAQSLAATERDRADVELLCLDATRPLNDWESARLTAGSAAARLVALTKCDAARRIDVAQFAGSSAFIATSSLTGQGLDELREQIALLAADLQRQPEGAVIDTAMRCEESMRLAAESLERAEQLAKSRGRDELLAIEVRAALDALGRVVGAVFTDDVLDRIFSRFCIGK
jgi:tRNA modification GTPase